jgi:hypothetical protein
MDSSPRSGRAAALAVLGVLWVALVAVAVRFDAAFDLPRGVRAIVFVALVVPLAGVWQVRPSRGAWPSRAVGGSALAACGLLALSLAFVPDSGTRVRRVLFPWTAPPPAAVNFRLVTATGDLAALRGEPLTLAAYLDRTGPAGELPTHAELTLTPLDGDPADAVTLAADDAGAFTHTVAAVTGSFRYCFRVGPVEGESGTVTVVERTELLPDSTLTLAPPGYAARLGTRTLGGPPATARALQFSRATLTLRFNHRPDRLGVTWTPADGTAAPLPVEAAGATATCAWELRTSGELAVRLGPSGPPVCQCVVTVATDAPPAFDRAPVWPAAARPGDRLPLDVRARDDVSVASLAVEFRCNADPAVHAVPLTVPGLGTATADGVAFVPLPPGAKVGDALHARLVAADGRLDPARGLTPQRAADPADGWATFPVTADARPPAEQAAAGRCDELTRDLARLDKRLAAAIADFDHAAGLTAEQRLRLRRAEESLRVTAGEAGALARGLRAGGDFDALRRPLAAVVAEVNGSAGTVADVLGRTEVTADALRRLDAARAGVGVARAALAPLSAEVAAATERRLAAGRLAELASTVRAIDATRPAPEVRARLDTVGRELSGLSSTSPALQVAAAAWSADRARDLAAGVAALARDWHALGAELRAASGELRRERLRAATGELDRLEAAATAARRDTTASARAFALPTPDAGPLAAARDALSAGRGLDTLTELEAAAAAWDRTAARFAETADARREPREAIRQLDRVQADLARQFADGPDTPATRARLGLLQRALVELADGVAGKAGPPRAAREALTFVAAALADPTRDPRPATATARRELATWAAATPTLAARRSAAAEDAAGLQKSLAAARNPDGLTAASIAGWRSRLAKIDAAESPVIGQRLAVLGRALDNLAADLGEPGAGDGPADLAEAVRQAAFLADDLAGHPPADTRAAEIALRQRLLADPATRPADPAAEQRAITRGLTEAAARGLRPVAAEAIERSRELEPVWARTPDATAVTATVAATRGLARHLEASETDAERWGRLRAAWAEPSGFQKLTPAEAVAEQSRRADRLGEAVAATRAGPAQPLKLRLAEQLRQLAAATDPTRQARHRAAAGELLGQLAEATRGQPALRAAGPPPRDAGDTRVSLAGVGLWPEPGHAATARRLAGDLRALGRATSEAFSASGRWPAGDAFKTQLARLTELTTRLGDLSRRTPADDPVGRRLAAALTSARGAVAEATAGRAGETLAATRVASANAWAATLWALAASPLARPEVTAAHAGRAVAAADAALAAARAAPSPGSLNALADAIDGAAVALTPGPVGPPEAGE